MIGRTLLSTITITSVIAIPAIALTIRQLGDLRVKHSFNPCSGQRLPAALQKAFVIGGPGQSLITPAKFPVVGDLFP